MRYLKLFEDISSDGPLFVPDEDDIREAIRDIFVELEEDDNFRIWTNFDHYQRANMYYYAEIQIDRYKGPKTFEIGIVKDKIEMIIDIIKDKWQNVEVTYRVTYVGADGLWAFANNLNELAGKGLEHIIVTVEKVDYKPTFIDKVSKFFKRK